MQYKHVYVELFCFIFKMRLTLFVVCIAQMVVVVEAGE